MCYANNAPKIRDEPCCTNCVVTPRELENLANEWRSYANFLRSSDAPAGMAGEIDDCATELERLINGSTHPEREPLLQGQSVKKGPKIGGDE